MNVPYLPTVAWVQPSATWSSAASAAASTTSAMARQSAQYPWPPRDQDWPKNICQARVTKPAAAAWAMAWS